MDSFLKSEIDRNPYSIKLWFRYFDLQTDQNERFTLFERSLSYLPRSYKIWRRYLNERISLFEDKNVMPDNVLNEVILLFELALRSLNKMPRIWLEYSSLMCRTPLITSTRNVFDRALKALPITQHYEIWENYLKWAKSTQIPELSIIVYKRYILFNPIDHDSFVQYLIKSHQYDEAVKILIFNKNTTNAIVSHDLAIFVIEACSENPSAVQFTQNVDVLIRDCVNHYSDEVGKLWCLLAEFYLRRGNLERAFDVFEEGIESVATVKDFTLIFESYVRVTEGIVSQKMSTNDRISEEESEEIDMYIAKLEYLVEKRSLLLNSVILRQNPDNVSEWLKRVKLLKNDKKQLLLTYVEALKTVRPLHSVGKFSALWLGLANFYERDKDYNSVRSVFEKAVKIRYKSYHELAFVWCAWAEFELRCSSEYDAYLVLQKALKDETKNDAIMSVKLWSFYLDLEESIGTIDTCRAAYTKTMDLGISTVNIILNYCSYLQKLTYFEESFQVYERAVNMFTFPESRILWSKYISQFAERYSSSKLERLRDIFEQALTKCPPDIAGEFFLLYSKYEEEFGYERNSISILDRSLSSILPEQRFDMYVLLIRKVEKHYGITRTRAVYERSILDLDDESSKLMCLDFADTERKLGEIDRARAILKHGSQLADPKRDQGYWEYWKQFEEAHGNEETFREMLRIKRSVEAVFSHVRYASNDSKKENNSSITGLLKRKRSFGDNIET